MSARKIASPRAVDLTSAAFKRTPFVVIAGLRAAGEIVRIRLPLLGPTWLALSYRAVSELLKNSDSFVMEPQRAGRRSYAGLKWWMPGTIRILADNMLLRDDPDHRRLRRLVDQAFHKQDVTRLRGRIDVIADELLDSADGRGDIDLVAAFARPLPLYVISEMLGLPHADRPVFANLAGGLTGSASALGFIRALPKIRRLTDYLRAQFESCRRSPREGLITALLEARDAGDHLSENELLAMVFLLLMAGHETTTHLISVGALTLLQHPDQKHSLLSDWSTVDRATEELLRYTTPVQMTKPRHVARDMDFFGRPLKRGDSIMALLASANVDPAKFEAPETLQLDRHPNPHLAFGTGPHVCLGLQLARAEAQIAYQRLFSRFPDLRLAVAEDELVWAKSGMRAVMTLPVKLN